MRKLAWVISTIAVLTVVCTAVILMSSGGALPKPDVVPLHLGQSRMDEVVEVARIKSVAQGVTKNGSGYWEARFADAPDMIFVPGGNFQMGNDRLSDGVTLSAPSAPAHTVTLSPYWISQTPVTIGQYRAFVADTGYTTSVELPGHPGSWVYEFSENAFTLQTGHRWDNSFHQVTAKFPEITLTDDHPVVNVSWYDCLAYSNWLAKQYQLQFTLPSEAEWEFAARSTHGGAYPWGDTPPNGTLANYADEEFDKYFPNTEQSVVHDGVNDGFAITSPVGSFPKGKSPFGVLDMAGNVTEWVFDYYHDYPNAARKDPVKLSPPDVRMQKAGFWAGSAGRFGVQPNEIREGHNIRADARQGDDPASADDHLGCRVAISYTPRVE